MPNKLLWSIVFIVSVILGILTIFRAVNSFNKFEVITNVERITPKTVTFPAITICTGYTFYKNTYLNGILRTDHDPTSELDFKKFLTDKSYQSPNRDRNTKNLEEFITSHHGDSIHFKCIRFNGITNKSLEIVDQSKGPLTISIRSDYTEQYANVTHVYSFSASYLYLFIEDNYLNSFFKAKSTRVLCNKNYEFLLEKTDTQYKLGEPYNLCIYTYPGTEEMNYRQENCIEVCMNGELERRHNCSLISYYEIKDLPKTQMCNSFSLLNRVYLECEKLCPRQCESTSFRIKSSGVQERGINATQFVFSFGDFSSLNITQIPKTELFDLVSNIGGILSLFIGVTFLSLFEIFEFLIEILYVLFMNYFA